MSLSPSVLEERAVWGILLGLLLLPVLFLIDALGGSLAVVADGLAVVHVLLILVSMYFDISRMRSTTDWRPNRVVWLLLALPPGIQVFTAVAYLVKRSWVCFDSVIKPRAIWGFGVSFVVPVVCLPIGIALIGFLVVGATADVATGPEPSPGPLGQLALGLVYLGVGTHLVGIPLSMYADTEYVRETTHWNPARDLWIALSILPLIQTLGAIAYLIQRTRMTHRSRDRSPRTRRAARLDSGTSPPTRPPQSGRGSSSPAQRSPRAGPETSSSTQHSPPAGTPPSGRSGQSVTDRVVNALRLGLDIVVSCVFAYLSAMVVVFLAFGLITLVLIALDMTPSEVPLLPEWWLFVMVVLVGLGVGVAALAKGFWYLRRRRQST